MTDVTRGMLGRHHPCVAGVDVSLTSTGVAVIDMDGRVDTGLIRTSGHRADTYHVRSARLVMIAEAVVAHVPAMSYVLMEGPSYGSAGVSSSIFDRSGLWHLIYWHLTTAGHAVSVAAPATVKKWATGSGNADKAAVAARVARMAPDVDIVTSDIADSVALALMGAERLGWAPTSKARLEQLSKVAWWE